jgi:hypothetical protein
MMATARTEFGHGKKYPVQLVEKGQKAGKFGDVSVVFILAEEASSSPEPGEIVDIYLDIPVDSKLLVPVKALTYNKEETGFYVLKDDFTVEFKSLQFSVFDDDMVEILDNQLENKQIVVEGNYLLKPGDLVKVLL